MTGNGDAHAKNFSVLPDIHGRWQPTPAHDLPNSTVCGDHTMALFIDGRREANMPTKHFAALGMAVGLPHRVVEKALKRVADSTDQWMDGLEGLPFDAGVLRKLKRTILNRQRMLRTN